MKSICLKLAEWDRKSLLLVSPEHTADDWHSERGRQRGESRKLREERGPYRFVVRWMSRSCRHHMCSRDNPGHTKAGLRPGTRIGPGFKCKRGWKQMWKKQLLKWLKAPAAAAKHRLTAEMEELTDPVRAGTAHSAHAHHSCYTEAWRSRDVSLWHVFTNWGWSTWWWWCVTIIKTTTIKMIPTLITSFLDYRWSQLKGEKK